MKKIIDGILLVEGIHDEAYLSSFLDVEIVTTNGFDIPIEEIEYVRVASLKKKVIIFTDPDNAGQGIRKRLNNIFPNAENAFVDINKCNKHGKHGVAECEKEEILSVLSKYITETPNEIGKITYSDLYKLGLIGHESNSKKEKIIKHFHLGKCTSKKLLKRLNLLNISLEEIKEVIDGN